jgi:sarcosine oxidase
MLVAGPPRSEVVEGSLASAERWGLRVDALDATSMRARFPFFSVPPDATGAYEPDAGIVRPEAVVKASVDAARARGAELRITSRVRSVSEDSSGVEVATDEDTERADAVVIATGAWTPVLLPEFASLLTVTRQVQAWFEPTAGTDVTEMPCWLLDRGPGTRSLYGLPPDPGASCGPRESMPRTRYPKVAIHGSDETVDPDLGARPVVESDIERIRHACRDWAPALTGRPVDAATCLYTLSPDGNFMVGLRRGFRRTLVAAGLSGHGFKLAPALGDALVDLALKGRTELPLGFLSPERFATP